jgi:hypothetical protein
MRSREYLTDAEVERLMKAAGGNRCGHRDAHYDPDGLIAGAYSLAAPTGLTAVLLS